MTFDDKSFLDDRICDAIEELDADYIKAKSDAAQAHEIYWHMRDKAKLFHEQRMILLQARHDLWRNDNVEEVS